MCRLHFYNHFTLGLAIYSQVGVISYISSDSCVLRTEQDSENKHRESPQEGVVVVGHQCQTGGQEVHVQQSLNKFIGSF